MSFDEEGWNGKNPPIQLYDWGQKIKKKIKSYISIDLTSSPVIIIPGEISQVVFTTFVFWFSTSGPKLRVEIQNTVREPVWSKRLEVKRVDIYST